MSEKEKIENLQRELDLERCRYRWAMEEVTKHDNRIDELKKQIAEQEAQHG